MAVQFQGRKPRLGCGAACLWAWLAVLTVMLTVTGTAVAAERKGAVLIVDGNTGNVLYASNADEPRHPASLTKLMTLYLTFEMIEQGRLSYQTKISFSAHAANQQPSRLDVEEGDEIALLDAIKVLITKSANDVAVAIAERIAGTEERFAQLMTRKARQLGMMSTTFRNASGLPDDEQVTTARDMATLALRLQDNFPQHYPLFATRTYTFKGETFRNHNTLLFNYRGTDGMKTGYIRASGFNLVTSVHRGRKHIIGVIFGGATAASRNAAMRTYLNMGLVKASNVRTRKPSTPMLVARASPTEDRIAVPTPHRVVRPAAPPPRAAAAEPPTEPVPVRATRPIEIARVRPVLIGEPATQPFLASDQGAPPLRRTVSTIEDILARAEDPGITHWASASASAGASPLHLSAAVPQDKPALMAVRGATPSTFQAQAANLARGDAPLAPAPQQEAHGWPAPREAPAMTSAIAPQRAAFPVPPVEGGFEVQIGAFQNANEAERQLAAVRDRAPALLGRATPATQAVRQGGKVLYRARYGGFDQRAATSTCSELKRLRVDCLVVRAD